MPPSSAVSLRLTEKWPTNDIREAEPREKLDGARYGEAKPHRTVRRQSREVEHSLTAVRARRPRSQFLCGDKAEKSKIASPR